MFKNIEQALDNEQISKKFNNKNFFHLIDRSIDDLYKINIYLVYIKTIYIPGFIKVLYITCIMRFEIKNKMLFYTITKNVKKFPLKNKNKKLHPI